MSTESMENNFIFFCVAQNINFNYLNLCKLKENVTREMLYNPEMEIFFPTPNFYRQQAS